MYHIFVLIALMASQNQVDKIKKYSHPNQTKKAEQLIPSYPPQPNNGDILDQFKKELAKEDEAVNKMTKEDLESFGLDSVDNAENNDGDFLNTEDKSAPKQNSVVANSESSDSETTLTGPESDKKTPPKTELAQKKEEVKKEEVKKEEPKKEEVKAEDKAAPNPENPKLATIEPPLAPPPIIADAPKPAKEEPKIADNSAKDSSKKSSGFFSESLKKIGEFVGKKPEDKNVKIQAGPKTKEQPKLSTKEEKKPVIKKKTRKEIRLERLAVLEEAREKRKLQKLETLRKRYLNDFNLDNEERNLAEDEYQRISSILPQKKIDPRIINVEVPPQLLDRVRSRDNKYHPILLTYKERVNFMFKAIATGRVDDFNALFNTINRPNLRNSYGDTLLTFSILMQKHGAISSLLDKGADPNLSNDLRYKPMNLAIELIDYKSVFLLSEMGADINFVDELGRTYLMQAARVGSLPIVDFLISKGVDLNKQDKNGMTALGIAYRYNKDIIVKYLLKSGAKSWIPKNYQEQKKSLIEELEHRWN